MRARLVGVTTPVDGPLGVAGMIYGAISGTGQATSGLIEIGLGAIAGHVDEADQAAKAITATTTVAGVVALIKTKGDTGNFFPERRVHSAFTHHSRFLLIYFDFLRTKPGPTEPDRRPSHEHPKTSQRPADSGDIESDPFVEEIQSW